MPFDLSFKLIAGLMVFEEKQEGILLRVRLTPNSSSCHKGGVFCDASGTEFLKITVVNVPEKGKANQELLSYLSKQLREAKGNFTIISGDTDRYKKIMIKGEVSLIKQKLQKWLGE